MGQKVHPYGFRIGVIRDWQSKWYSAKRATYAELVHEDVGIRRRIESMRDAGISGVDIDRNANQVSVTIRTARPGIVIGRQGKNVEDLRKELEKRTNKRVRVNIVEINVPELDARLVARSVADQLERRVAHRRAMKQTAARTMQRGAQGIKINVGGRLGGSEMSRKDKEMQGQVPLHTLRADIDYGTAEARTTYGQIGVKVWIYKGEILPERASQPGTEEAPREGPAPAIAPESVRGSEVEGPAPTAEAIAEATGQPAPRRRTRKVEPEAAPGAESPGAEPQAESLAGAPTENEAAGATVAPEGEITSIASAEPSSDGEAHEDTAIAKADDVPDESGGEVAIASTPTEAADETIPEQPEPVAAEITEPASEEKTEAPATAEPDAEATPDTAEPPEEEFAAPAAGTEPAQDSKNKDEAEATE